MIRRCLTPLLVALLGAAAVAGNDPPKPAPIVLDEANLAKLREVAFEAAREGDVKALSAYFEIGQPVDVANKRGDTLLILAAYHGHEDAVRVILARPKVPVDARNKMGFTATTGAAYKGYVGIVKMLAEKGADLNAANDRGQTPLMFAALFGRVEVVRFLVKSKVDLGKRDERGRTALSLARDQGKRNAAVIALLEEAEKARP